MLYQYRYIDTLGKKKKGTIQATNVHLAKEKLRSLQVQLLSVEPLKEKTLNFFRRKELHIPPSLLIAFTTQLAQLLIAGIPLYESLTTLAEEYAEEAFHPILLHLCEEIKRGGSLSLSMKDFPSSFDSLYCSMVAAGEAMGSLDRALEKLSHLLAKQNTFKKQIITALVYPLLLCAFSVLVVILLLISVIPSLEVLFEGHAVNGFTSIIMKISHTLTHGWPILLIGLLLKLAGCYYLWKQKRVRRFVDHTLLKLPILKTLIAQTALARFTRTTATLLQGGIPLLEALKMGRLVMRQPLLEEVIERAEKRIVEGSLLSTELRKSPLIPSLVFRMLAIGEEGGTTALMLHKIADIYEEEVEKTLARTLALVQPILLVIMGGLVGLIMLAVLLPLTDMNAFL